MKKVILSSDYRSVVESVFGSGPVDSPSSRLVRAKSPLTLRLFGAALCLAGFTAFAPSARAIAIGNSAFERGWHKLEGDAGETYDFEFENNSALYAFVIAGHPGTTPSVNDFLTAVFSGDEDDRPTYSIMIGDGRYLDGRKDPTIPALAWTGLFILPPGTTFNLLITVTPPQEPPEHEVGSGTLDLTVAYAFTTSSDLFPGHPYTSGQATGSFTAHDVPENLSSLAALAIGLGMIAVWRRRSMS